LLVDRQRFCCDLGAAGHFAHQRRLPVLINISARHGHLSDASRTKITAKLEKLARLFERLQSIEVTIDLEHEESPTVDLRVSAEHKHDFVATEGGDSLWEALDLALHKLEMQLRKYKEKVQDHHRGEGTRRVP
jgi:putative sigma-54 modulation protein